MSDELRQRIETTINAHEDPYLGATLGDARALRDIAIDGDRVRVSLRLGFPLKHHRQRLAAKLRAELEALEGVAGAEIEIEQAIGAHSAQQGVERLKSVKNIIAVASGKGGVGKSTVAANLALALAAEGASVGMLDADIYGPSQPRMLGVSGKPTSPDGKTLVPMSSYSIKSMSVGYLVDQETPMVWRGPMVSKALQQLLNDTDWGELDYLIVDMPPGTGDIQLTLSQQVPVSGAVTVTTPQDIATLDARKGVQMFQKVNVPILGIVENMSLYKCAHCGHEDHVFGEGGGGAVAAQYGVSLLGSLPLDVSIREAADGGRPSVVGDPGGDAARHFTDTALRMAGRLSLQARDYARKFPKIVVEDS